MYSRLKNAAIVAAIGFGVSLGAVASASATSHHENHVNHVNHVHKMNRHASHASRSEARPQLGGSEGAARDRIKFLESSGNPNASNGQYHGLYQLGGSQGYGSEAQQTANADAYVQGRYGSWQAALAFHNANGWY